MHVEPHLPLEELNPIENLWHYLKSHFWSNRAYNALEEATMDAGGTLCSTKNSSNPSALPLHRAILQIKNA